MTHVKRDISETIDEIAATLKERQAAGLCCEVSEYCEPRITRDDEGAYLVLGVVLKSGEVLNWNTRECIGDDSPESMSPACARRLKEMRDELDGTVEVVFNDWHCLTVLFVPDNSGHEEESPGADWGRVSKPTTIRIDPSKLPNDAEVIDSLSPQGLVH